MAEDLTLSYLTVALLQRLPHYKNKQQHLVYPNGVGDWTLSQWSNALAGEVGEACNVVKKIERDCDGKITPEMKLALGEELADAAMYMCFLAARAEIDLEAVIRHKFNKVAREKNLATRI